MEELLASTGYKIPSLRRGQEVTGKVISVAPSEVLIDVAAKSEGIIAGRELAAVWDVVKKLAVGDTIEATVLYPENDAGQVVLSLKKLSADKRWQELEEKIGSGEAIEVLASEANRGGVICEYFGIRGFLPASQLSQGGPASQLSQAETRLGNLIGKMLIARVIEVDRGANRLILSQKEPKEKDLVKLKKLLSAVKIGDQYEGTVSAILPFGIFVEIELGQLDKKQPEGLTAEEPKSQRIEGLVHISEISWDKIDDATKMFNVGDKLTVMVIAKDEASGRLNLSLKQLSEDPFVKASAKYAQDQQVSGTVSKITPYGVFVSLDNGVEGLIHISKIPPEVEFNIGEPIECLIESVDTKTRRIALVPVVREKPVLYR